MKPSVRMQGVAGVFAALFAVIAAGCTAQGISRSTLDTLESDKHALQQQLAAMAPTMVVQAGQLALLLLLPPSQRDGTRQSRCAVG